ncbi:FHA domain-containing protein [Chitinivorax sp. PXF-14]|uniref:SctD/MshK family protein n=1 Tax=Chitinivorax sp. PXF-14 TaxID=3230488 RepID=UPI003465D484
MATLSNTLASLTITAGLHEGAEAELMAGRLLVIGADDSCDLVLADPGLAPQQLALLAQPDGLTVRALAEGAELGGTALLAGYDVNVAGEARLTLPGGAALRLTRHARQPRRVTQKRWLALAAVLLLGGGLTSIAALDTPGVFTAAEKTLQPADVVRRLGLGEQVQVQAEGNGWRLSGVVADEFVLDRLRHDIGQLDVPATLAVTTAPQLTAEVAALLRLKGVSAAPHYVGQGVVAADGARLDPAMRQALADTARRDIRGLAALRFDGVAEPRPVPDTPVLAAGAAPADPEAKRVVSVVEGEERYVVTADGGRYFEGAWLPSGHRVARIADGKVWLARGKQMVELAF